MGRRHQFDRDCYSDSDSDTTVGYTLHLKVAPTMPTPYFQVLLRRNSVYLMAPKVGRVVSLAVEEASAEIRPDRKWSRGGRRGFCVIARRASRTVGAVGRCPCATFAALRVFLVVLVVRR